MGRHYKPRYIDRGYVASGRVATPYIDAAGNPRDGALPAEPPFVFKAVTSRVFPLKANMARLTNFCDEYLNMDIPPSIAHFRPSLPYVYLMVLNYGSMAAETVRAQNVGWVSQHEMTFTVPLEWWRQEQGRMVFKDWACVSPFIFVDDALSLTTGREVYGWPKVAAQVDADVPLWTRNPQSGDCVFSLSSKVFPKLYAGKTEEPQILLQIDRVAAPAYSTFPLNANNPWNPFAILAEASTAWLGLAQDAIEMLWAPRIRGYAGQRGVETIMAMYRKAGLNILDLLPNVLWPRSTRNVGKSTPASNSAAFSIQNITLKQFRAVEDPNDACYQALVSSKMGFDRLNQTGLLGDLNLLRADPSGGFTVRIHRYPSQPIIESLGLDVVAEHQGGEGVPVAILKPTLPFWTDVDLYYDKGRVICSRASGFDSCDTIPPGKWVDEQKDEQESPPPSAQRSVKVPYNTALGAATQPVSGPFTFPDVTLQAFPLLADHQQLACFVERYMNEHVRDIGLRFEPHGAYVYMLVNVFDNQLGSMWSSSNNIGWWAEREVSFVVPVKWFYRDEFIGLALLTPFVYANSGRAVITDREVNGRPTLYATIEHQPDVWLTHSGPVAQRRMLRLATEMFPATNLGQKAVQRTLLEIDACDVLPADAEAAWHQVAEDWGVRMVTELKRKSDVSDQYGSEVQDAKALSLELLAHQAPFNFINLKQYRDAWHIERACYQAVVLNTRSITRVYDWREMDDQLIHVRVHRSPGHPIVKTLGLAVKRVDSTADGVVDILQPIRPFWMRMGMQEDLGKVIAWRAGDDDEKWLVRDTRSTETDARGAAGEADEPQATTDPTLLRRTVGETRVGSVLGQPGMLQRDIAGQAGRWLRKALVQQLTQAREVLRRQPDSGRRAVDSKPLSSQRKQLDQLLDVDLESLQTDAMIELTRALIDAGVIDPDSRSRRAANIADADPNHADQMDLQPDDPDLKRLTFEIARGTIKTLADLQVVIEHILSDGWENRALQSRRAPGNRPVHFVPAGSVYGDSQTLEALRERFLEDNSLQAFDNVWGLRQTAPEDNPS